MLSLILQMSVYYLPSNRCDDPGPEKRRDLPKIVACLSLSAAAVADYQFFEASQLLFSPFLLSRAPYCSLFIHYWPT